MYKIDVTGAKAVIRQTDVLTVGMVGSRVEFRFDEDWNGLAKTAVFTQGNVVKDVPNIDTVVEIPYEVLQLADIPVAIGVYGIKGDGSVIIPTTWAVTQPVKSGADPSGDESIAYNPDMWEQMSAKIGDISNLSSDDKNSLVVAINEAIAKANEVKQNADNGVFNAKISGVSAESVDEDEGASVENKGTPSNAVLHFKIPQGKQGEKGDRGAPGESFYAFFSTDEIDAYIAEKKPTSFNALWLGSDVDELIYGTVYNITVSYDGNGNATGFSHTEQGTLVATGPEGPAGETACICSFVAEINDKLEGYTSDYLSFLWAGKDNTEYNYISATTHTETKLTLMKGDLYRLRIVGSEMVSHKLGNFQGEAGKSAYDIYVEQGGTLSENEWLEYLKGSSVSITKLEESDESGGKNNIEFSDGNKLTVKNGKDGEDGLDAAMYSHKVYKIYSLADIDLLCATSTDTRFNIINCGEAFSHTSSGGDYTAVNTGDIFRVSVNNGTLGGLSYLDNSTVEAEEGTLLEWYEPDDEGGYVARYTAVLNASGSGSAEYEHIITITTTAEDVANERTEYSIEADGNGNSINLKEFICFCTFPAVDTAAAALVLRINGTSVYKRTSSLSTSASYIRLEAALRGKWVVDCMQTTSTGGTAPNYMSFLRGSETEKAHKISISVEGNIFPEGSTIEVYGVRA